MRYYALEDLQYKGQLMHTGRNTNNKKQLLNAVKMYIEPDLDPEEDIDSMTLADICEIWQFDVVYQNNKFKEW